MAYHLAYAQFTGTNPQPQGTGHGAFAPYGAYDASDGRFMLGISNDRQFRRLAEALERPEWLKDERYTNNVSRVENRPTLDPALNSIFVQQPRKHWISLLDAFDIPVSPIQTALELLRDPQLEALGQMHRLDLGEESVLVPRLPFEMSETPPEPSAHLPRLGEHSRDILAEAGFSDREIEDLQAEGVFG